MEEVLDLPVRDKVELAWLSDQGGVDVRDAGDLHDDLGIDGALKEVVEQVRQVAHSPELIGVHPPAPPHPGPGATPGRWALALNG
ncbi:hypothetical protein [Streptomyces sp. NPDC091268]|uniref:hypothetical protein n=1 Tax=Streptomyces sp. NPDC091268 TaxID=3365979 RepID=UPI0037F15C8A